MYKLNEISEQKYNNFVYIRAILLVKMEFLLDKKKTKIIALRNFISKFNLCKGVKKDKMEEYP